VAYELKDVGQMSIHGVERRLLKILLLVQQNVDQEYMVKTILALQDHQLLDLFLLE